MNYTLSADEIRSANTTYVALAERYHWPPRELDEMLQRWENLVIRLEGEEPPSWASYFNDMHLRYNLEVLLNHLPDSIRDKLVAALEPWDRRFEAATQIVEGDLSDREARERGYWSSRIPMSIAKVNDAYQRDEWARHFPDKFIH